MELSSYSVEQALKLTKHSKTSRDALKMSKPTFWKQAFRSKPIIWATYKGKSIQSYHCRVGIKKKFFFHCNCSSRQTPCRHALALLILFLEKPNGFKTKSPTADLMEWWEAFDPEAQPAQKPSKTSNTNSLQKRLTKMKSGILEVETWLHDLFRQGLSQLPSQDAASFQKVRERMTDAGLGGLRIFVDQMEELIHENPNWLDLIHQPLTQLLALVRGLEQYDQLKPLWQREVLLQCGVHIRRAEVEALPPLEDQWTVLWSQATERADGGFQRSAWLYGQSSKHYALLLDFNYRDAIFPKLPKIGFTFNGALTYYPTAFPQRAILRWSGSTGMPLQSLKTVKSIEALNNYFSGVLKSNPWQRSIAISIAGVKVILEKNELFALDKTQAGLALDVDEETKWKLLSISLDYPEGFILFGEYDGLRLNVLGMLAGKQWFAFTQAFEATNRFSNP